VSRMQITDVCRIQHVTGTDGLFPIGALLAYGAGGDLRWWCEKGTWQAASLDPEGVLTVQIDVPAVRGLLDGSAPSARGG